MALGLSAFGAVISAVTLVWILFIGSIRGKTLVSAALALVLSAFWYKASHRLRRPPIWVEWYAAHSTKLKIGLWAAVAYMMFSAIRVMLERRSGLENERLVVEGLAATLCALGITLTIMGLRGYEILPKWLKKLVKVNAQDREFVRTD